MKKNSIYLGLMMIMVLFSTVVQAQNEKEAEVKEEKPAWEKGAGIGLDFAQLFQRNPKQGSGQNRMGLGGAVNFFGKYKEGRLAWNNVCAWQFGIQKMGSGLVIMGNQQTDVPFQKSIDELRIGSKFGYKTGGNSKFFYTADLTLLSQLTPAYAGTVEYPGFFISDVWDTGQSPLSKLFAPATLTLSVGIDYKPTDKLSFYYSPLGAKWIIVADDDIAEMGVHGNPVVKDANGNVTSFENVESHLGSLLKMAYANKLWEDKLTFTSGMSLFSNYLKDPQNIDVDWTNELAVTLFKGLQLSMLVNVFYDHDVKVQISDADSPGGVSGLGRRTSVTEQLLIKYNLVF